MKIPLEILNMVVVIIMALNLYIEFDNGFKEVVVVQV